MATPAFSAALITKLKAATAWRFHNDLGPVFTPRFFCCSDPNELGIVGGKQPVAVLSLVPNPALPGDTITFDGTDSYDPDGSITGYAWTFESGTPATSSDDTNTVSWAATGEYEVTLVVTDGTGLKSSPARVTMQVVEPAGVYYMATSNGVWFTDDGGQNWTAKNTGLSGDALKVNDLKIDPAAQNLADENKTMWIATDAGIYVSNDGAGNWTQKNPASVSNVWSDSPAPTISNLRFQNLLFHENQLYAIANWLNGSSEERSWLFRTDDLNDIRIDDTASVIWDELDLSGAGS